MSNEMVAPGTINREREQAATKTDRVIQFIKLLQGQSKETMDEERPGARPGTFILGGEEILKEFRVIVPGVEARFHAILSDADDEVLEETWQDGNATWDLISACQKKKEPITSPHKAMKGKKARCGLELLFWLPDQDCFTIQPFMNTARSEAKAFLAARDAKQLIGCKSKKITAGAFTWFVPKAYDCGRAEANIRMPTKEQFDQALEAFLAPMSEQDVPVDPSAPPR
jgi:hypothetical protein